MADDGAIVELKGVWYGYPPHALSMPVLEDVDLQIGPGDFLGVIGPNGGGKTTLLKIILGFLRPQRGTVSVLGGRPQKVSRRIGYVPQNARIDLAAPASVLDVVRMGRLGVSSWGCRFGREDTEAAMAALERTQTADLADRPIAHLSGGQRQRVLIARALAGEAKLLLLDEPTAGVDAHIERGLTDLLHRLSERMPIVLVSHDVSFISRHLKRVACLNHRLTTHAAHEVSAEVIAQMYHGEVRMVQHEDSCPLADPGCAHGCPAPGLGPAPGRGAAGGAGSGSMRGGGQEGDRSIADEDDAAR
ncbi:MAG: ABC transporter ATP-binding protein [Planctomycetota bacterium]|nr:ABC transporter ATP-binding protein [Planctomycetota bacterium]